MTRVEHSSPTSPGVASTSPGLVLSTLGLVKRTPRNVPVWQAGRISHAEKAIICWGMPRLGVYIVDASFGET